MYAWINFVKVIDIIDTINIYNDNNTPHNYVVHSFLFQSMGEVGRSIS